MASSIAPYTISVPDSKLDELRQKLETTTFPDELDDAGWTHGVPLADVKRLAKYWKETYDWRKHEAKLNELLNYHTAIQVDGFEELDIHFVYQKSDVEGAIPLLFSHGCKSTHHNCPQDHLKPRLNAPRARQLHRSDQTPLPSLGRRQRLPSLPRRRSLTTKLRLLSRDQEERLRAAPVR